MTPEESHAHSLATLEILNLYQDFMDNFKSIADMGCGYGYDSAWLAQLKDMDNRPRNIKVTAIDLNIDPIRVAKHPNITYKQGDYSLSGIEPNSLDFVNAHNSLQFALSPFHTLLHWHSIMKTDAMLLVSIPYNFSVNDHRLIQKVDCVYNYNSYFNWTLGTLIMTLAATGFDCRHGYFKLDKQNNWVQAAVYKLDTEPQPTMNWYDMCDQKMLPLCIEQQILKTGTFKETDIVCEWIDRSQYILAV